MQSKFKRILVTAALPYANGPIHLGHLAGAYIPADIFVRYQRLKHRDILFICGSDEHGVPITITADKEGVSPQVIVDRFHAMNAASCADPISASVLIIIRAHPCHFSTKRRKSSFWISIRKRSLR